MHYIYIPARGIMHPQRLHPISDKLLHLFLLKSLAPKSVADRPIIEAISWKETALRVQ